MRKKKMKRVDLPQEILEQIYVKLPIKSIARFRCVSKPWSELLTDLKFLEKYFELVKKRSNINFKTMVSNGDNLYSLEFEPSGCSGNLRVIKMDHTFRITEHSTRIMGSCKGLICIAERCYGDVYLWNPNTLQINHKADHFYPNEPDEQCNWSWLFYGFGYNSTKRDFRLVRIYSTDEAQYQSHVHVYALRRNSWRNIDYFRMPYIVTTHGGTLVNDNLHWPACRVTDLKLDAHLVIAYNIHNGKGFKEVELPDFESKHWFICSVGVLNGFLTVCFGDLKDKTKFEAWIMLDYGLKESWRNLFKITTSKATLDLEDLVPLYFMNNGTEILLSNRSGFYLYDSKDQDEPLKKYEVHNLPRGTYQSIAYLDSDISPR